jgi:alpha-1,6-mannosyltransferase
VYGPVFTLLSAAIGGVLAGSPNATILAFKLLAGMAMMGTALVVSVMCRSMTGRTGTAGTSAFAAAFIGLNPVLVVHTVGGGHNDTLVALGIAAAAAALSPAIGRRASGEHERRRYGARYLATALLCVTAFLKVVASIPLLLCVGRAVRSAGTGRRIGVAVRHGGVALAVAALVTVPLFAGASTLGAIANLAGRQGWASPSRLVGRGMEEVGRAIGGDGLGSVLRTMTFVIFLAPFAVFVARRLRRAGSAEEADPAWEWGVALLLFALGSPYLLPWYAAWFLVLLPAAGDERLLWIGLAASAVLALTGMPAEPVPDASAWQAMLLVVHYVAAPIMLILYALTVRHVLATASAGMTRAQRP